MTHSDGGDMDYDKTTAVHPLALIREVKKYEVMYNKQSPDYSDNAKKELIWERIYQVLFPQYAELDEATRNVIKRTVRKRWKSLRDALVKDTRLRAEDDLYAMKKQSLLVKEMQYLVPYIKTPRFKRNADSSDNFDEGTHSPDFRKLMQDTTIDLTFQENPNEPDVEVDDDECGPNSALYPSVRLTTSGSETGEVEWRNGFCVAAQNPYKSTYTIREIEEPALESQSANEAYIPYKRKRSESDPDLQSKIIELVERCNAESQDEDRMFLLSLLSDFKRLPVQKKLKVKAAFVTTLSGALD